MRFPYLLLAPVALLFASCASHDVTVISKERAMHGGAQGSTGLTWKNSNLFAPAAPSATVVAKGKGLSSDKHGMPLYSNERVRHVRTTAYTCTEADHLEYGSMNAAGTRLRYSSQVRSAAADWSVYPVGTTFRIKGMPHLYVVDDYGSALTGTGTVDLYKPSHGLMNAWGRRNVEIAIVQWGSYARSAQLLSGRTHHAHCARMYAAIQRKTGGMATAMC